MIVQGLQTLVQWIKAHPLQAVGFASGFSTLSACYAFREDWLIGLASLFGLLLVLMCFSIRRFEAKTIVKAALILFLTVAMALPADAQLLVEDPGPAPFTGEFDLGDEALGGDGGGGVSDPQCGIGPAIGVVVICVGAYCIYRLVKFCQKKFPKNPPPPPPDPDELSAVAAEADTDAAAYNFGELGSCLPCDEAAAAATASLTGDGNRDMTFVVNIFVGVNDEDSNQLELSSTLEFRKGVEAVQNFRDFAAETQKLYGVKVTGASGTAYFAHNGVPVTEGESIFQTRMEEGTGVVKINRDAGNWFTVVVESSYDLVEWTEVLRTEVQPGTTLGVEDATRGTFQFYRYHGFLSD